MMKDLKDRQSIIALAESYASDQPEYAQTENQDAFMIKAAYPSFEGSTSADPYFKLSLILHGEGVTSVATSHGSKTCHFRQGMMNIIMPQLSADVHSSAMNMLGVCINLKQFDSINIGGLDQSILEETSISMFEDTMLQSVMLALWQTSKGCDFSSLFFREGIELILNQLCNRLDRSNSTLDSDNISKIKLKKVQQFIAENISEQICVADMATEAGVNETHFFNMCRKTTGMTPFAFLTHCRLQKAKQILSDGGSVIESSISVGYANPSKFSAAFRRHIGQSPSQWKKLNLS